MEEVTLTVIIISHNQKEALRRCIDSVLRQETSFPVEVIVSDDRSTDGTREMLLEEYGDRVVATFCNSNDCNPAVVLERSGYNRLNGLKLAHGKYLIHTDGDDFYTGTDLFQAMVDTLEAHPECNLCCQNYCKVDADKLDAPRVPWNDSPLLRRNAIYDAQEFFSRVMLLINGCYCMRRAQFNGENLWGGTYDDNYITARYIGTGKVAVLDRCDLAYVQYGHSTCGTLSDDAKSIFFRAPIGVAELAPAVAGAMLKKYTAHFSILAKRALGRKPIPAEVQAFCSHFRGYAFHRLSEKIGLGAKLRYLAIYLLAAGMSVTGFKPRILLHLLYRLALGKPTPAVVI